jgi:hypothetical protein
VGTIETPTARAAGTIGFMGAIFDEGEIVYETVRRY